MDSYLENLPNPLFYEFVKKLTVEEFITLSRSSRTLKSRCDEVESVAFRFYYKRDYNHVLPHQITPKVVYREMATTYLVQINDSLPYIKKSDQKAGNILLSILHQQYHQNTWRSMRLREFVRQHREIRIESR
ncbi:MAG: hypothetical protein EOP45_21135 [Sphingobacteriaceae bacterium]|nr:MAG: hypothetical protein EOP45_21135 [Sphingobacteriaceae bacterium]